MSNIRFTNGNFVGGKAMLLIHPKEVERIRRINNPKLFKEDVKVEPQIVQIVEQQVEKKVAIVPKPERKIHKSGFLL